MSGASNGVRNRVIAGLVTIWLVGCVGTRPGAVPQWAMHVQPATIDGSLETDQVATLLARELGRAGLPEGHLAPEQIAAEAVRAIQRGHLADAGLWLALASYRYHQEAMHAAVAGVAGYASLPYNVRRSAYTELVVGEVRQFSRLDFHEEMDAIVARLHGRDELETALQEQLTGLGKTNPIDREALRDALSQLRPNPNPAVETTFHPALAEAFRRRLRTDAEKKDEDRYPAYYLARTPIATLQREAIFAASTFFEPGLCEGVAEAFPAERQAMVAGLAAGQPEARANAAATLALAPAEETRAALEARLGVEPNSRVKLVLAYALIRHGVPEHIVTLTSALQSCGGTACTLPASLVDWLPREAKAGLDQGPLARIAAGGGYDNRARRFAAATLLDLGRIKPLELASVEALLVAGRGKSSEDRLVRLAMEAVGESTVLSRADVVARLESNDPSPAARQSVLFPGPLLARLARVSQGEDLPLLKRIMRRFGDADGLEAAYIVEAALHVPGEEANAYLVNWYNQYERVRTQIAAGLATRNGFPPQTLERLVVRGDALTQIVVKMIQHAPDVQATIMRYLGSDKVRDKFQAARLAGMTAAPATAREELRALLRFHDDRYYPNDALVRHAAIASLVRLALADAKPSGPPAGATPAP